MLVLKIIGTIAFLLLIGFLISLGPAGLLWAFFLIWAILQ